MVRILNSDYFLELLDLYFYMYKSMYGEEINKHSVTKQLITEMEQPGYLAFGIFDSNNTLVGAICGFGKPIFIVSVVICKVPYLVKKLYKHVEDYLVLNNYTTWKTEAKTNIKSIAPKLGAKIDTIIYKKEL